jgi:hypothetical protein
MKDAVFFCTLVLVYTGSMKAKVAKEVKKFQDIPNVGPAIEHDFKRIGLKSPADLKKKDAYALYTKLCTVTGKRHDPCVFDTFIAAVDFMNGAPARSWYYYTKERKKKFPDI